jgi:DNA-directed RNA polymerase subunit beta
MTSSQMRQAIMLKEFTPPLIGSGCEGLYTDYTQFIKRAKKDGEVIYLDGMYLIVQYDDGETDIFNISYRRIYVEHLDLLNIYVRKGDKFKKGDILAESNFCKNGNINIGQNLLTGVMIYYGYNYEDGIVISDRLVKEKTLTSVHYKDLSFTIPPDKVLLSLSKSEYKPLPNQLDIVKQGDPYAILKKLTNDDLLSAFSEEIKMEAKRDFMISEVNLFANTWNKEIPPYYDWIDKKLQEQQEKENYLKKIIKEVLPSNEAHKFIRENDLEKFTLVGKYKQKKEKINGILVEIIGVHFRNIKVGDKIANRHGNKGIISRIVPHDKMPQLPDGRHLDICINPLGIISRMNIGQLYELHLAMSFADLKKNILEMINKKVAQSKIKKYLLDYIAIVDKTKDGWLFKQMKEQLPAEITKELIDDMSLIQPPFESCNLDDVKKAMKYTKSSFRYDIYDPISKEKLFNPVSVGYLYFFRMVHIAEEKLAARGIGAYTRRTLQPLGGRKNKGGQRCGEMETACIIGHDAPYNLFEFFTTKSDCIDLKNDHIRKLINPAHAECDIEIDTVPESVKLLKSYLTVIGVELDKKPGGCSGI